MLNQETKRKIDSARNILVGKVPDPKAQVEQITTALIYKFMDDMDRENIELGGSPRFFVNDIKEYSWSRLLSRELSGQERLDLYTRAISELSKAKEIPELFRMIFKDAYLPYRDAETLNLFLKEINSFTYENSENLGNAFEYLLSILGSQGDAGQFRTPRHIIDFIVEVVDPKKHERVLDPACGTAGFLISAYKHIKRIHSSNYKEEGYVQTFAETDNRDITTVEIQKNGKYKGDLLTPDDRKKLAANIVGYDISPDMVRLSLVNLYLHGFNSPQIFEYDSLTYEDRWDETFDVILANPPFMTPKGGIRPHKRFQIQANRAEVLFVDYIMEHLKINGRAGIIVPEGIVFQSSGAYKNLRKMMVDDGYLWAVVSLPSGVFNPYSGVKTSILFLDREIAKKSDEILFVKVENDGFDLGAQRRRIDQNDLPRAFEVIRKFEQVLRGEKKYLTYGDVRGIAHTVKKEEIIESGDYSLSGDKYRKEITTALHDSAKRISESLLPYQAMFDEFAKRANEHHKQIVELQESIKPFVRYIQEQEEVAKELFENLSQPIIEIQKAWSNLNFGKILEAAKYLESSVKKGKWPSVELEKLIEESTERIKEREFPVWSVSNSLGFIESKDYFEKKVASEDISNYKIVSPECFAYNPSRINVGSIALNKTNNFGAVSPMYVVFKITDTRLLPEYLLSILKSKTANIQIDQKSQGAVRKQLRFGDLCEISIPLPPIEEQRRIVSAIETYQRLIDGAKTVLKNWQPTISIQGDYEELTLKDVCEVNPKKSEVKEMSENEEVSFVPMESVNEHQIDFTPKENRKLGEVYGGYTYFKNNDVLLAKVTPCFENGKSGIARKLTNGVGFGSSEFFVLRASEKILPEVIYYTVSSKSFIEEGSLKMTGTGGLQRISRDFVEAHSIKVPSIDEQKRIIEEVETERKTLIALRKIADEHQQKIDQLIDEAWGILTD